MVLDHLMIKVKDWPKAKAYYEAAFKPLGYTNIMDGGTWGGFGVGTETAGRIFIKQGALPRPARHEPVRLHTKNSIQPLGTTAGGPWLPIAIGCWNPDGHKYTQAASSASRAHGER